ncbi:MAG: phosphate ABC transporter permease PstA [Sphaerochaetaceae bacterium]
MTRGFQKAFKAMMISSSILVGSIAVFIFAYVMIKGIGGISWSFLSASPSYLENRIGILPDILNTLYVLLTTLAIVLVIGVASAIYLSEYAESKKLARLVQGASQILSGIPSIIYGLVGMLFFCQILGFRTSLLAGSMTLVIMCLPTIMKTTQESLEAVREGYRESSFALGAGKWRTVRSVVLPCAADGIVSGCILCIGRILGESAALLFTAGLAHSVNGYLEGMSSSGATLTVALYVYAKEQGEFQAAFPIATILLVLALAVNLSASAVGKRLSRGRS